jgi:hypothetical protein
MLIPKDMGDLSRSAQDVGRWGILVLACILVLGCESMSARFVTGVSGEQRAMAAALPVHYDALPEGSYELVGPANGLSCQIDQGDPYRVSEQSALLELKRATIRAGGNSVMAVNCEKFESGAGPRFCFQSIECRGDAVRVEYVEPANGDEAS